MAQVKQATKTDGRPAATRQSGDLQINEDLAFQRRDWFAQRIGWGVLGLVLVAGLLGLTGSGPLSRVTRSDGGSLTVEYDRFVRHGSLANLTFRTRPGAVTDARIAIDRGFLVANDLQRLVPEPDTTRSRGDEIEFAYEVAPGGALNARWTFEPEDIGRHTTTVRLNDGAPVEIRQFTYP
jgi:hypothetical protein